MLYLFLINWFIGVQELNWMEGWGVFKVYSPSHFLHANPFEDHISHWVIGAALESNLMVELLPFLLLLLLSAIVFLFVFRCWLLHLRFWFWFWF